MVGKKDEFGVGSPLGCAVGSDVGAKVGGLVGALIGLGVGKEGLKVGVDDCIVTGAAVEESNGPFVGTELGLVGCKDGILLGGTDRVDVGPAEVSTVGMSEECVLLGGTLGSEESSGAVGFIGVEEGEAEGGLESEGTAIELVRGADGELLWGLVVANRPVLVGLEDEVGSIDGSSLGLAEGSSLDPEEGGDTVGADG